MRIAATDVAYRSVRTSVRPWARAVVRVRIWDLPTRLFHWGLALCIVGLAVTGYMGGAMMDWHARLGYAVLALLLFRTVWGFVGGLWSRFESFKPSATDALRYMNGKEFPEDNAGHSPVAALAVYAMLCVVLLQVASGLFSDDQIGFTGPLNALVSANAGQAATWYHKMVGQWLLAGLVAAHIGAVAFYFVVRKRNLVGPMIVGDKLMPTPVQAARDDARTRALAAAIFAACALAAVILARY
jgi:cytochrome b